MTRPFLPTHSHSLGGVRVTVAHAEVAVEGRGGLHAIRARPRATAFADDERHLGVAVKIGDGHPDQLAGPHPGGDQHPDHGDVAAGHRSPCPSHAASSLRSWSSATTGTSSSGTLGGFILAIGDVR